MIKPKLNLIKDSASAHPFIFEFRPRFVTDNGGWGEIDNVILEQFKSLKRLDAIFLPQIVEENGSNGTSFKTGKTREFAKKLGDDLGKEVIVSRVVAHSRLDETERYAKETLERGIRDIVLVGGENHDKVYLGPSVPESNLFVRDILSKQNGLVINIMIPHRKGEPQRMVEKTITGAGAFITQMLFDPEDVIPVLLEYADLCELAETEPQLVILSFAPLRTKEHLAFYRDKLRVHVPDEIAEHILENDGKTAETKSIENTLKAWYSVVKALKAADKRIPIGIMVEQVTHKNLAPSLEMARAVDRMLTDLYSVENTTCVEGG